MYLGLDIGTESVGYAVTDENYNNLIENNNEEKNDFWNFMRSSSYCRINIC